MRSDWSSDVMVLCDWLCVAARQLTVQMMQNPEILAALQERLDGLVGSPSGYMERYQYNQYTPTAWWGRPPDTWRGTSNTGIISTHVPVEPEHMERYQCTHTKRNSTRIHT